jgi:aminodeoxyfutalosine deaminase
MRTNSPCPTQCSDGIKGGNSVLLSLKFSSRSLKIMLRTIHRAKYALAEPDLLLKNAAIHVSAGGRISRIESIGSIGAWNSAHSQAKVVDWGSSIIIPGLVNAHVHLELTALRNKLTKFRSFTDWISQLIHCRQSWTKEDFLSSAAEGSRLSLASGTTLAGDITSSGIDWSAANRRNLRRVSFEEVIALSPDRVDFILSQLNLLLKREPANPFLVHGVSPHAPYSVSPELYRRSSELVRRRRMLLATHVAETQAELEFLQTGTGEFRSFLAGIGALPNNWKPPELSPVRYFDDLGVLGPSCLLVHCNYLDKHSIARILKTHSSVVYCPRSHDFFGHENHPIRQLLDSGINVALGTDSLASNFSLSMIDEMRFLFEKRKDIKPEEIFRAATMNGAAALHYGGVLGRLRRSYWADMAVLEIPQNLESRHWTGQILEGAGNCIATIVQGKIVYKKGQAAVAPF